VKGRVSDHEDFLRATLRHADLLHTLAVRLAPHPADAADIVQDTYLRAYALRSRVAMTMSDRVVGPARQSN
jgi:DNA-directed RNA polymerase specialized sigma24 family protein